MVVTLTENQTLLQDAAERYLRESYDFNHLGKTSLGVFIAIRHSGALLQRWAGWHYLIPNRLAASRWARAKWPSLLSSAATI